MIKFFRHIRQPLIMKNPPAGRAGKTSKYLKYAIGEIVLVVIGILIALQINNWNENQKLKKEETKLLNALVKEVESNISLLDTIIIDNDSILKMSGSHLKKGLENPNVNLTAFEIVVSLGYNTNKYETSIINEILGTNSKALISNDKTIAQLRTLKQAYDSTDKIQFYMDEFWNSKVSDYITRSGLGFYLGTIKVNKSFDMDTTLQKEFYSLLGMMNGYQYGLLLGRQELREELNKTLTFLKKHKP